MRKPTFCICENKDADQLRVSAKLISAFVFSTWIVWYLYFLNSKFQASSHLQWVYSLVCVRTGQNPHCWSSHVVAHMTKYKRKKNILNMHFSCHNIVCMMSCLTSTVNSGDPVGMASYPDKTFSGGLYLSGQPLLSAHRFTTFCQPVKDFAGLRNGTYKAPRTWARHTTTGTIQASFYTEYIVKIST